MKGGLWKIDKLTMETKLRKNRKLPPPLRPPTDESSSILNGPKGSDRELQHFHAMSP